MTGAGRGIGRDVASALAIAGAHVVAIARSEHDLADLAEAASGSRGTIETVVADVRDAAALEGIAASAQADLLVTAAGINRPGRLTDIPLEDASAILEINVNGTLFACRAFGAAATTAGRAGAVVTISSQMGAVGYPGRVAYCASKHAINGLTKALALEWAPDRIRVNAVAPTFVHTPMTAPMLADPEFKREVLSRIPLGRLAEVNDVTSAVCFLLSEEAAMVTGHVMAVDGGWTSQ